MPRIAPIPMDQLSTHSRQSWRQALRPVFTPPRCRCRSSLIAVPNSRRWTWPGRTWRRHSARRPDTGAAAHPQRPAGRVRALQSITQARLDHRRRRRVPARARHDSLTPQEQMAVEFLDRLSGDHHSIDDEFYQGWASISLPRRSSNSVSPAPQRWDCTASCTPSTSTATRSPSSTTPPTKSIRRRLSEYGRDRIGSDAETPQAETLHALTDFGGI